METSKKAGREKKTIQGHQKKKNGRAGQPEKKRQGNRQGN
jgi:hypothetical protein|tara:strand:+ start:184 stop:303 length:120 start_codon:yes stop_codon:yes gene_type:complete